MTAYQEDLLSLDELRNRMPDLRQRERAMHAELQSIGTQEQDRAAYLRLAETLSAFLGRLRFSAEKLNVLERQRIVRLLVKEVLVGDDAIVIRHSIPVVVNPTRDEEPPKSSKSGLSESKGYLLRSERNKSAARQSVPALCVRHLDGADIPRQPVRAICGRCHRPLPEQGGGGDGAGGHPGSLCGVRLGASSDEDQDRLLQGC